MAAAGMSPDCAAAIGKAAGGKLTEDEVSAAFDRIAEHKRALIAAGKIENMEDSLKGFAAREAERTRIAAAMQRRHAALNILARDRLNARVKTFIDAGMKPHEALLAIMEGSQRQVAGARASVGSLKLAYENNYVGGMYAQLVREVPHFKKLLADEKFDDDVTREMAQLHERGTPGITKNADALKVARIFAAFGERSRTDANRLGASIGKLDGWTGPQSHDDMKMLAAGKDAWVKAIAPHLDMVRTFEDIDNADAMRDALGDVYDTLITGLPNKPTPRETGQRVNPANLARSLGKSRVLHFKNADAALAYREQFGFGNTVSGMVSHLRRVAGVNAQMATFGPNPEIMLGSLVDSLARQVKEAPTSEADRVAMLARFDREEAAVKADKDMGDRERSSKLLRIETRRENMKASRIISDADKKKLTARLNADAGPLRHAADAMSGLLSRPVNVTWSKIMGDARAAQNMAKLGAAWFSSVFSDPTAAAIASQARGSGFFRGLTAQWEGIMKGRPKGELEELTYLAGEGYDGMSGHIVSPAAALDGPVGALSKLQEKFFKLNGLTWYTDLGRGIAGRVISAEMGMRAKVAHSALPPVYRKLLSLHGIDKAEWQAIRSATFRTVSGRTYVTPERMRDLDDAAIEPLVAKRIAAARKASRVDEAKTYETRAARQAKFEERRAKILDEGRHDLEMSVRRFFADEVNYAVIETDARSQRTTTLGTRPGTAMGEAVRSVMQFKGFPIAFTQKTLGRAWNIARDSDRSLIDKSTHVGTIISSLAVAGYMGMTLKDLMRGYWPPRDPADPRTWAAALAQGGAIGIYGDYLFGENDRLGGGAVASSLGPVAGTIGGVIDLYQKTKDATLSEEGKVKPADFLTLGLNNAPGLNLFYVRPALDYLILNELRDAWSPGYLRRQERKREREYGQRSFVPRQMDVLAN